MAPSISKSPWPKFKVLSDVETLAKGNDGVDHAQRDAAVDELKQDFHKSGEIDVALKPS
jgi:hypothetical protein